MEMVRSTSCMSLIMGLQTNLFIQPESGLEETEEGEDQDDDA